MKTVRNWWRNVLLWIGSWWQGGFWGQGFRGQGLGPGYGAVVNAVGGGGIPVDAGDGGLGWGIDQQGVLSQRMLRRRLRAGGSSPCATCTGASLPW